MRQVTAAKLLGLVDDGAPSFTQRSFNYLQVPSPTPALRLPVQRAQ